MILKLNTLSIITMVEMTWQVNIDYKPKGWKSEEWKFVQFFSF